MAHDGAPGLGPLKDGDAGAQSGGDLRVVVVDGSGADNTVRPLHAPGQVADGHRNAQGAEVGHRSALPHVRASDADPFPFQHLGQGGHRHPAHTHQMGPGSGLNVVLNVPIHGQHLFYMVSLSILSIFGRFGADIYAL